MKKFTVRMCRCALDTKRKKRKKKCIKIGRNIKATSGELKGGLEQKLLFP